MANSCKFYKQQKQVSMNSGATWDNVVPFEYRRGDLIERDSEDCREGTLISRWLTIPDAFICEGRNKYEKMVGQYSLDNGSTWDFYNPSVYQKGLLLETNSEICHNKWEGHYYVTDVNGCSPFYRYVPGRGCVYAGLISDPLKFIRCASTTSTTLTHDEVLYNPYRLYEGYIGDCVTAIGDGAFENCSSLTGITIPNGVTSIGQNAFNDCDSITSITIPDSVTTISGYAFYSCDKLENVIIGNSVTSINSHTFFYCTSLTSVTIPDSVTSINYNAFYGCSGLTDVTIGSGVTNIGDYVFYGCSSLSSVTVNATTPPQMLARNHSFDDVSPDLVIYVPCTSVRRYKTALGWREYADKIEPIPPCEEPTGDYKWFALFDNSYIESAACDSSSAITRGQITLADLTSVDIGDCVSSIGEGVFSGCTTLTSVTIPDSVTSIPIKAFYQCSSLISVNIPDTVTSIGYSAFTSCSALTSINIPDGVTIIDTNTFAGCYSLSSITIPDSVTSIGGSAFSNCSGMTSVTIGSGVTSISDYAFYNCNSLTGITIEAVVPPTIPYLSSTFAASTCPIYVPATSVEWYKTGNWSIYANRIQCIEPCEIYYRWVESGTTCVGFDKYQNNIKQCSNNNINWYNVVPEEYSASTLIEADSEECGFPESYKYVVLSDSTIVSTADCDSSSAITQYEITMSGLSEVVIGDCVSAINSKAFNEQNKSHYLTSITLSDSVRTIGSSAFTHCFALTSITIPDSVTSIGQYALQNCSGLTDVTIGSGVTSIGTYALYNCSGLTSFTSLATTPPTMEYGVFSGCGSGFIIYVPAESINAYKSANRWSTYASRIQPIT